MLGFCTVMPDEALYSILARYSIRADIPSSTLIQRFAPDRKKRLHPYLPTYIRTISNLGFGSERELLTKHSLYPLFSFFSPSDRAVKLETAMLEGDPVRVMHAALLPANQFKFPFALKYCLRCVEEDVSKVGVSYWHLQHQIPGVEACHRHGILLCYMALPTSGWGQLNLLPALSGKVVTASSDILRIATFSAELLHLIQKPHGELDLIGWYTAKMSHMGWITKNGSLRRQRVLDHIKASYPNSYAENTSNFPRPTRFYSLARPETCLHQHPVTHITMLASLLGTPDELWKEHIFPQKAVNVIRPAPADQEEKCVSLLSAGLSVNRVALLSGKSRTYVKQTAFRHSIEIKLCPRRLTKDVTEKILLMAKQGASTLSIAEAFKLSQTTIELVVAKVPGLKEERAHEAFNRRLDHERAIFEEYHHGHPLASRSECASAIQSTYYWLYRNDKCWLESHMPHKKPIVRPLRVNWEKRDTELSRRIVNAGTSRLSDASWSAIDRSFGGHGWFTKKRDRLPKAVALLKTDQNPLTEC